MGLKIQNLKRGAPGRGDVFHKFVNLFRISTETTKNIAAWQRSRQSFPCNAWGCWTSQNTCIWHDCTDNAVPRQLLWKMFTHEPSIKLWNRTKYEQNSEPKVPDTHATSTRHRERNNDTFVKFLANTKQEIFLSRMIFGSKREFPQPTSCAYRFRNTTMNVPWRLSCNASETEPIIWNRRGSNFRK